MTRAFLGLGSNLGDRRAYLQEALDALAGVAGVELVAVSGLYETEPVGGPAQGTYLNLVAEVDVAVSVEARRGTGGTGSGDATGRGTGVGETGTGGEARALLEMAQALEEAAGRVRAERWGPRTLDVDVLWVEGVTVDEDDLVVPHPRLAERRFVLAPLAELAPEVVAGLVPPGWERSAPGVVTRLGGPELVGFPPGGPPAPPDPRRRPGPEP